MDSDQIIIADSVSIKNSTVDQTTTQDLSQTLEVGRYVRLDLALGFFRVDAGTATFEILTSMQREVVDESWVSAGTFTTPANQGAWTTLSFPTSGKTLLRYVRWRVTLSGGAKEVSFKIWGLARTVT